MHHVERGAGDLGEPDRAVRRLALALDRPRERVIFRVGVAGCERLLHEDLDHVAVLGVDLNQAAVLGARLQRLEDRLVVDLQDVLVGHEDFERIDALLVDEFGDLGHRLVAAVGDREVKGVVDDGLPIGFPVPRLEGVVQRVAARVEREVDDAGRPAECRAARPRFKVVGGDRPAEGHVEVRVRVDAARHDVCSAGIDGLVAAHIQLLADRGDLLTFDQNVGFIEVGRRSDRPAADQDAQDRTPLIT